MLESKMLMQAANSTSSKLFSSHTLDVIFMIYLVRCMMRNLNVSGAFFLLVGKKSKIISVNSNLDRIVRQVKPWKTSEERYSDQLM